MEIIAVDTEKFGAIQCPDTNFVIDFYESYEEEAISKSCLAGVIVDEVPDVSCMDKEPFRSQWEEAYNKNEEFEEPIMYWELIEAFSEEYAALEVTTPGFACGPVSSTTYYIFPASKVAHLKLLESEHND